MAQSPLKTEPSLQIIAAANVAISLWKHIDDIPNAEWEMSRKSIDEVHFLHSSVIQLAKQILLPKPLTELIKKYARKICNEVEKWLLYHRRRIFFFNDHGYYLIRHFSHFAWHHDCTIDYVRTARNLQNSISLNEMEKFRFLCLYCLKDEIEQKWKLLVQNEVIGSVSFDHDHPLIHYWRFYCKNRLQDVPVTRGLSIDEFMFRHSKVDNWPAKEYFFDRINVNKQVRNAIWIVDHFQTEFQTFLIMKLNQSQRYMLYVNRSVEILSHYANNGRYFAEILPIWFEIAEIITEEDFVALLKAFFSKSGVNLIIARIWISAPDKLKLRVLNSEDEEFVRKVGKIWMNYYDDSFRMLLDSSTVIRKEVRKTIIFDDYCEILQKESKFTKFERVLRLCFPTDEEFISMKRKLSQIESFTKRCMDFMKSEQFTALEQLFNFFSDVIDLNAFKGDFVKTDSFRNQCRSLVNCGKISKLCELVNLFLKSNETGKWCLDFFGKDFFFKCGKDLIIGDKLSKLDEFLNCFHFTVEESMQFKRNLSSSKFFGKHYRKLINLERFTKLKEDLIWLFPCVDELNRLLERLSRKIFVIDLCEKFIIDDKLTKLDELVNLLFPCVEKSLEFKQYFTTKDFFHIRCIHLIVSKELPKLELLMKFFYPNIEEVVQFLQRLTRNKIFIDYCRSLITTRELKKLEYLFSSCLFSSAKDRAQFKLDFADNYLRQLCQELITENQFLTLDDLLQLFLPSVKKSNAFKKILLEEDWFNRHCETLIISNRFSVLKQLLKWTFADNLESNQFIHKLANTKNIRERCLSLYAAENFEELHDLLSSLFLSYDELICEHKRNLLLLSEEGFEISLKLAEKSKNILNDFIVDCLPTSVSLANFKKQIIFSPMAVSYLKQQMLKDELTGVKICLNRFLTSVADRKEFKMHLLDNAVELFTMYFFKLDKFSCQSRIKWWLPDKTAIKECKQKLSVDEVFEAGFKTCVFEIFDPNGRVTRSTFRKGFNLESLDRFLNWYFGSSKEIKEFKMRKIQTYESMETISVLLKNGCRYSHFKQVLDWFFENDAVEMAKFKKKHEGEKIASMINTVVGQSYSKRRRTL